MRVLRKILHELKLANIRGAGDSAKVDQIAEDIGRLRALADLEDRRRKAVG